MIISEKKLGLVYKMLNEGISAEGDYYKTNFPRTAKQIYDRACNLSEPFIYIIFET